MTLRGILVGLASVALAAVATPAQPKVYALVVGADAYAHIGALHGAVNDAQLLAQTLKSVGATEVRLLTDAQVTRAAVMDGFRDMVAKAGPGDWVVFSYAGHGWQEPETVKPFRHPDGMNNAILLTGFEPIAPGANERIRDFEIAEMLARVPPEVKILFIADACHSGTLTREVDPRAKGLTYRATPYGPIAHDELPPEPKDTAASTDEQPNVVFAAAALDTETAPELAIAGKPHGALSWYVARALSGEADQNRDGVTTLAEFRSFVTAAVRAESESRQTPDVRFVAGRGDEALPILASAQPAAVEHPAVAPVGVWVLGGDARVLDGYAGLVPAPAGEADFVWDPAKGEVVNRRLADPVAQNIVTAAGMAGVADKWRALPVLYALSAKAPLSVRIGPDGSGKRYAAGSVVTFETDPPANASLTYFTAFNLAGNGAVEEQFPGSPNEAAAQSAGFRLRFSSRVQSPFGADHLVIVATAEEPVALRAALRGLANKPASGEAVRALAAAVTKGPYAVGIAQLYTGP